MFSSQWISKIPLAKWHFLICAVSIAESIHVHRNLELGRMMVDKLMKPIDLFGLSSHMYWNTV
jgi:hypothetical protein